MNSAYIIAESNKTDIERVQLGSFIERAHSYSDRPDIVVFDTDVGKYLDLDISFAHPWSTAYVKKAAKTCEFAAMKQESIKSQSISQERLPSGDLPAFISHVFEHFACWEEKATKYLRHLSKKPRDD